MQNCPRDPEKRSSPHAAARRRGLSRFDVAAVAGVLLVLFGMLAPAVLNVREAARGQMARNNMRQIGQAVASYYDTHASLPVGSKVEPEAGTPLPVYWARMPNSAEYPRGLMLVGAAAWVAAWVVGMFWLGALFVRQFDR